MVIILLIAALILIGIVLLVVRITGTRAAVAPPGRDRFKVVSPGESKPKEPRATGLN